MGAPGKLRWSGSRFSKEASCRLRAVPRNLKRYYGDDHLHFITFSCFRRLPLLTPGRRDLFLRVLENTRTQYEFLVVGYVVMPEHVHLLLGEPERRNLSVVIKALKQALARRVLRRLRQKKAQLRLFGTEDDPRSILASPLLRLQRIHRKEAD